jgi:hypothetical protein
MKYQLLRDEIISTSIQHKVKVEDLTAKIKDQIQHQQISILKARNDESSELRHIHRKNEQDIQARYFDMAAYQDALKHIEITHKAFLHELNREYSLKESELYEEFQLKNHDVTKRWEQNLHTIREESQLRSQNEIDQLTVENKTKSNTRIKEHEEVSAFVFYFLGKPIPKSHLSSAFLSKISGTKRMLFNGTLNSQLDEIKTLKATINHKRQIVIQSRKLRSNTETKNEEIKYPYENSKQDVDSLANRAVTFEKTKKLLLDKKTELKVKEDRLRRLKWKHEILFQQHELLDAKKNEKQRDVIEVSLSLKQRKSFTNTLLKKDIDNIQVLSTRHGVCLADTIDDDQEICRCPLLYRTINPAI